MRNRIPIFLLASGLAVSAFAQQWSHVMPVELYQTMNLAERSALDRALKLFDDGGAGRNDREQQLHRNATNEWERFRSQYADSVDSEIFAYSLFMQAKSQRASRDRHTAVRTFTEVLDFFPDEVWLAAPSLYFRAMTHFDIGDDRRGFSDLREMADHPAYGKHSLAAGALNRIADNHWENKRPDQAVEIWKKVAEEFGELNRDQTRQAADKLYDWTLVRGNVAEAYDLRLERESRGSEEQRRANAIQHVFQQGVRDAGGGYYRWYFNHLHEEDRANEMRDALRTKLYEWFVSKQSDFLAVDRLWDFLLMRYDYNASHNQEKLDELLLEIVQYFRSSETEPNRRVSRAKTIIDRLARSGRWDNALSMLEFIPEPTDRLWTEFELSQRRRTHEYSLTVLDQIDGLNVPEESRKALAARARIHHRNLNNYEEAIKLYHEINDPPDTLWEIVDCHRRLGNREQARNVLTEIASIFPDLAPRALYMQAEHYRSDGEQEQAVNLYRSILRHPEWRRSREASQSHDRLEAMGLDTAGGVIHEVH
ncbi:MAG: tetratricopeptide repeat protein [Verrucomicrobia bacterium]|nr:tetratricopeptide repeat protein [Verrucomicrobiota bacterium]MCH8511603.1 tetratricopeptide repeat protein [Kiritimatiellia bacterium]